MSPGPQQLLRGIRGRFDASSLSGRTSLSQEKKKRKKTRMDTQRNQTKKNINLRRHRLQLIVNSLALFVHLFLIVLHRRITISRIYTQQCAHTHTHQTKNDTLGGIIRHNLQGLPQNANKIIIKKNPPCPPAENVYRNTTHTHTHKKGAKANQCLTIIIRTISRSHRAKW